MPMGFELPKINGDSGFTTGGGSSLTDPYLTTDTNWFKSKPYGFAFYSTDSSGEVATSTMYLPISPNNLTISTHYATNVITTLYGIVEEHSEIRYYDISIDGTTGIAPRYVREKSSDNAEYRSSGRSQFDPGISLGGFLPEVTNTINQIANTVGSITNTLTGSGGNATGVAPHQSGYAAFHSLYKFLHKYKQDTSGQSSPASSGGDIKSQALGALKSFGGGGGSSAASGPTRQVHPLRFLNYKDGNQYDVVPISFVMKRSVDNPMLYNYSIKLRAFNLRDVNETDFPEEDQLAKLGLGSLEGSPLFYNITSIAGSAATLISGLL